VERQKSRPGKPPAKADRDRATIRHILEKLNVADGKNGQHAFIEDMGQHMVGWGLPRNTGRVYAYLLLQDEPVSLDRMVADLEIAKSGASVATRQLVQFGMARASGQRGSRRVLYEALYNVAAIFEARNAQAAKLLKMYREGAAVASPAARRRLEETSDVVERLLQEMPSLLRRIQEGR